MNMMFWTCQPSRKENKIKEKKKKKAYSVQTGPKQLGIILL
jgi:hypothetical protein